MRAVRKKQLLATFVLLGTALIWGMAFVAQVMGGRHMDAFTFNGSRFLLGAVALVPVFLLFEKPCADKTARKKTGLAALCGGVILFFASLLQQMGIDLTASPGKAGFITGLYTVLTPLLAMLFLRKRAGILTWVGAALAPIGLYLLCYDGAIGFSFGKGELLLLLGAVFWAAHILVIDLFADSIAVLRFSSGQFLVCGALNLVISLAKGSFSFAAMGQGIGAILFCGLLSTGVGYTGQAIGQRLEPNPTRAAILLSTESVFSAVGGLLWNAVVKHPERQVEASMSIYGIFGCVVLLSAILLSQMTLKKKATVEK